MGVAVSGWMLARTVSRLGQLGVVSGTGLAILLARKLQLGDPDGQLRHALQQFPVPAVAARVLAQYFVPGGFLVLHFGQLISADTLVRSAPQFPQNFMFAGTSVLQLGQVIFAGGARLAPQLPQNLTVAGFLAPQLWQTISCTAG